MSAGGYRDTMVLTTRPPASTVTRTVFCAFAPGRDGRGCECRRLPRDRGLDHSAVGVHGFPGTWDSEEGNWQGWAQHLAEMRRALARFNPEAEVWITETGYSTWRNDEMEQARRRVAAGEDPSLFACWGIQGPGLLSRLVGEPSPTPGTVTNATTTPSGGAFA